MRVTDLLKNASIDLGAKVKDKPDAISHLVDLMEKGGNLKNKAQYLKDVQAREASGARKICGRQGSRSRRNDHSRRH